MKRRRPRYGSAYPRAAATDAGFVTVSVTLRRRRSDMLVLSQRASVVVRAPLLGGNLCVDAPHSHPHRPQCLALSREPVADGRLISAPTEQHCSH